MICDFESGWSVDGLGVENLLTHTRTDFFTEENILVGVTIKEQYREVYKPAKKTRWNAQSTIKRMRIKYHALYLGFTEHDPIEIPIEPYELEQAVSMRDYLNDVLDEFERN